MKWQIQHRLVAVCFLLVAGLSGISGKLVTLQWKPERAAEERQPGRTVRQTLKARTGYILDRNEELLARNRPVTTIVVDLKELGSSTVVVPGVAHAHAVLREDWATASEGERDRIIERVGREVQLHNENQEIVEQHLYYLVSMLTPFLERYANREALLTRIGEINSTSKGERILAKDIPEELADKVEKMVRDNRLQGLKFRKSFRRIYPHPHKAIHLIGFRDFKDIGKAGVEKSMSRYLEGRDGYEESWRDSRNLRLGKTSGIVKPPAQGRDVKLTIDLELQAIVESEIEEAMVWSGAEKVSIIVMEPHTGEILAMANRPHYDLNDKKGYSEGHLNFAVSGVYEPGSIMKIVATAGAIEEGMANPWTQVFCHNGSLDEFSDPIRDQGHYAWLSLQDVLRVSSNIGTYLFAKMLGREKFYDYMEAFGFGEKTGIELPNEASGKAVRSGRNREFASKSFGYAINVTPLQMAAAYSVIANGGNYVKPRLVHSVLMPNGVPVLENEPKIERRVLRPETASLMRQALTTVVHAPRGKRGTGMLAAVSGYLVAGKTGTARKAVRGVYSSKNLMCSFAGMMPADDPAFVCLVVVDNPTTTEVKHGGGTIAAPVFSRVASRVAAAMQLAPTEPIPSSLPPSS